MTGRKVPTDYPAPGQSEFIKHVLCFKSSDHPRIYCLEGTGQHLYRLMIHHDVFETASENGNGRPGGVFRGQSAITFALLNVSRPGDNIVAANNLYGGRMNLYTILSRNWGGPQIC